MYDYDPIEIMFVSIFLAIKLEDYSIGIKQFCVKVPQCSQDIIEKYQFTLLKGIKFDISFFCPFRAYKRLIENYCQKQEDLAKDKIFGKGYNFLIQLYKTNIIFLHSSGYLSLVSFIFSLRDLSISKTNIQTYLRQNIFNKCNGEDEDNQKLIKESFNLLKQSVHLVQSIKQQTDKKKIQKIRMSLKMFHKSIPQFMEKVDERDAQNKLITQQIQAPQQQLNKNSGFQIELVDSQGGGSNRNDKDGFAVPMPTLGKRKKLQ